MPTIYKPVHLSILRLWTQGQTIDEIVSILGVTPTLVTDVLNSPLATDLANKLRERIVDTTIDVQQTLQTVAPLVLQEKLRLALTAKDERVRNTACTDIINMAGHVPVRRIQLEQDIQQSTDYSHLTEDQIRQKLFEKLTGAAEKPPQTELH